jgi:hypothetical protein
VSTIGPELRNIDVITACARKRSTAKVNGAREYSRDDHVSRGIHGDSASILKIRIAEALAPEVTPGRGWGLVIGGSTFFTAPDSHICDKQEQEQKSSQSHVTHGISPSHSNLSITIYHI